MTFKLHRKTRFYSFRSGAWTCNPSVDRQQIFRFLPRCAMYTTASWVWIFHTVAPWIDEFRNGEKSWQKNIQKCEFMSWICFFKHFVLGKQKETSLEAGILKITVTCLKTKRDWWRFSKIMKTRAVCGVMSKIGCGILWLKEVMGFQERRFCHLHGRFMARKKIKWPRQ